MFKNESHPILGGFLNQCLPHYAVCGGVDLLAQAGTFHNEFALAAA